jgi:hypothetical protein
MIVNSSFCAATTNGLPYTGLDHCPVNIKNVRVLAFIKRGENFGTLDSPTAITLASLNALQVAKKAIVVNGIFEFTQAVIEDSLEENPDTGASEVTRKNPYDYTATFKNKGEFFDNELRKLESSEYYDVLFFDAEGTLLYTTTVAGALKGFNTGMVNIGQRQFAKGTTGAITTLRFQLTQPSEMSDRKNWVIEDELGFNAESELKGVNFLRLSVTIPSDGDTTVAFNILDATKKIPNDIFVTADVVFKLNGVANAGAVVSLGDGNYTKSMTVATGDVVTAQVEIKNIAGTIFESNLVTVTTIA